MAAIPPDHKIKSAVAVWREKGCETGLLWALEGRKDER